MKANTPPSVPAVPALRFSTAYRSNTSAATCRSIRSLKSRCPDPRTLVISPWDASCLKNIEKAILASDLGINPQNDGKVIRLAFPQPTEERRKELAKKAEKFAEECKIAVRNVRRDANEKAKEMKKNGDMTEDEQKASEKQIQDLTDKYVANIEKVAEAKKKEIMTV